MTGMEQFKCPSCGGTVEFNVGTQNMKCPYCDSEFDIEALKEKDKRFEENKEDSFKWKEVSSTKWQEGETEGLVVYACKSCGGEIVGDENMGAAQCPYCGNQVVLSGKFSGQLKPDYIIPFKYDKKQAKETFEKFIDSKKFVPKLFKSQKHIEEIKGVYVPFWLFDADVKGQASFNAKVIRTFTNDDLLFTETKFYNLSRSATMKFDSVPVDGSSRIANDIMESIEPFDFNDAVEFNTAYLAGFAADKYDVNAEESVARANERIKKSVVDKMKQTVIGCRNMQTNETYDSIEDEWCSVKIENGKAKYALYPVWLLSATYKGESYTFAMNGQTGKFTGDLPSDNKALRKYFWKNTGIIGTIIFALIALNVMS